MLVNPQQKLKNKLFYNNICLILCAFSVICFFTALNYNSETIKSQEYHNVTENVLFGPIEIKNKNAIYQILANFTGDNSAMYLVGEVLDEDKDTVYEFGKDLWHESGYDSEGYWSESERHMSVDLAFTEKGTYYIQLYTDNDERYYDPATNSMKTRTRMKTGPINNLELKIRLKKGSYIPHYQAGMFFMVLAFIIWYILNAKWFNEKMSRVIEVIKEMSEDD